MRYQLQIHRVIENKLPHQQLQALAHQALEGLRSNHGNSLKVNQLSVCQGVAVKLVVAWGQDRAGVTVTVPKPLAEGTDDCGTCQGVGFMDLQQRTLCPACNGLGYLEPGPL